MPRPSRTVLLVLLSARLLAQQPAPAGPEPVALVAEAERLLARKETEDAILRLWQALDRLAALPANPVHDATTLSARFLLQQHDPREAERRRVFTSVAKQQVELATAYRTRKWLDVAATRLQVADRYDRDAGAKERAALAAAQPKATKPQPDAPAPPAKAPPSLLRRDNATFVAGDWQAIDGGVAVPERKPSASAMTEWVTRSTHENHEIAVDFRPLDPQREHDAALSIGLALDPVTNSFNGVRIHCSYDPANRQYCVQVITLQALKHEEIASGWVAAPPVQDGWLRLAARASDANLEVLLGNTSVLSCRPGRPMRGLIGLVTGLANVPSCGVQFRNLRVDPLPADQPSDEDLRAKAEVERQNAITRAVDEAKDLVARKQPESASLRLREALQRVDELAPGVLRDNLRKTIEAQLGQTDATAAKRKKAAQTIGAELGALADQYAAAGMVRAAAVLAGHAADFDPEAQAPRVASLQERVQQWNVAQAAARANELRPPADDGTVLRDWFAKGRKLDTRSQAMVVEGASARIDNLGAGSMVGWLPQPLAPRITKASVHVRLPANGAGAGLCVDVVDATNFAIAIVQRRAPGLRLSVFLRSSGKWVPLLHRDIPMDAWRLDAWHPLAVESTDTGLVARCGDTEVKVARTMLGKPTGLFGLYVDNASKEALGLELRAFQIVP